MKKLLSSICASVIAASFALSSALPVNAAPVFVPVSSVGQAAYPDLQNVRHRGGGGNRVWRRGGGVRWAARGPWGGRDMSYYNRRGGRAYYRGYRGGDRAYYRAYRGGNRAYYRGYRGRNLGYYNGYRGYRYYQPGYRRYGDFWFPAAAFITGALIGGAIASQPSYYGGYGGSAHQRWCYNRYRSYRAWDNTFQPYNGPRRQCISPYGY